MLALVALAGCNINSKVDYVNNAHQLTWAVGGCTIAVPVLAARGNLGAIAVMDTTVHIGYNCSLNWYYYLKDINLPAPDADCATSCILELVAQQAKAGVTDTPEYKAKVGPRPAAVKEATDAEVEAAKLGLDNAVKRFDAVVDMVMIPKDAKR
jgi:hypothetical protein